MQVDDQLCQQILIGAINLIFTLVAMQLVDKVGRKRLFRSGSSLMAFFLLLIAACFYFNLFEGFWLTLVVLAFIATYATTLAPGHLGTHFRNIPQSCSRNRRVNRHLCPLDSLLCTALCIPRVYRSPGPCPNLPALDRKS